jgi:CheY-like chemotaxis protein
MRGRPGLLEIGVEDRSGDEIPWEGGFAERPEGWILISVRDDGCGMAPEIRARVFEPFFTTRRAEGGTGLGLSVVHGIVQRLGGRIRLETAPGEGTRFEILLPARERTAAAPLATEAPSEGTERVLFVDDEAALAANAQRALARLGYRVSAFTRAAEALSAFRAAPHDFDVLVTDLTMPGMTGDAFIRKARESRPDVPTILCTGFSERFDEEEARALGVDRFAMKPVVGAELARLVRELMDRA